MDNQEKKTDKQNVAARLKGFSPEKRDLLQKRFGNKIASPVSGPNMDVQMLICFSAPFIKSKLVKYTLHASQI